MTSFSGSASVGTTVSFLMFSGSERVDQRQIPGVAENLFFFNAASP